MSKHRIIKYTRDTCLIAGIILFLAVLLEGVLYLTFLVRDQFNASDSKSFDSLSLADDYKDTPWAENYFKEFQESYVARWEPYVYWRRNPYIGKYINIDANGMRRTTNSKTSPDKDIPSLRVFMFGGSALWGTGARDSFTIPSLLAKELERRRIRAEIINFGETGYVSTQEVIALLLQLQKGNVPDLVIFYDGVNDTFSAYQAGIAGIPQNETNREKEFNLSNPERFQELKGMVVRDTLSKLSTARFVNGVFRRLRREKEVEPIVKSRAESNKSNQDERSLAEEVVDVYMSNMEIVKTLAASYDFKSLFYLQPTIFEKKELSDYEKVEYNKELGIESFFKRTYSIMRKESERTSHDDSFHDVSTIFSDVREPVYIDWMHLSERGNNTIAQAMVKDLLSLIQFYGDAAELGAAPDVDSTTLHPPR